MVIVEQMSANTTEIKEEYSLLPYRERRPKWGTTFSLGYSSYEPVNYEPDFVTANFSDIYSSPDMPLIELTVSVKRNFSIGSFGVELAAGIYENKSDDTTLSDSSLQLIPIRLGLVYYMDAIGPEPHFVPYVGGGAYTMMYKEELVGGTSNNGNTQISFYGHAGVAFQLDWIDKVGSRIAYQESGIESTFLYAELQKYMSSSAEADGDFSNDVSYAGGLKIEF